MDPQSVKSTGPNLLYFFPLWPFKERSSIGFNSITPTIMNYYIQFALDTSVR